MPPTDPSPADPAPPSEPPVPDTRPERRPPVPEPTTWSPGLIAFYGSCAAVSLGAAIAAASAMVLDSTVGLILGIVLIVAGTVGCFVGLRAARR